MRVLLVAEPGLLRDRLVGALSGHDVVLLEEDPRDRPTAERATAGVEAVVCALPPVEPSDPLTGLDRASRGIYNLITTAAEAGHFVLLSTLRTFERYPLDHNVTEYWAPRPTTNPADLVALVGEAVVREAAHTLPLKAVCLRLGTVVDGSGPPEP